MTPSELNTLVTAGVLVERHTSWIQGYVSRKSSGVVQDYAGRFGSGYKLLSPAFSSTRYCLATYYIFKEVTK